MRFPYPTSIVLAMCLSGVMSHGAPPPWGQGAPGGDGDLPGPHPHEGWDHHPPNYPNNNPAIPVNQGYPAANQGGYPTTAQATNTGYATAATSTSLTSSTPSSTISAYSTSSSSSSAPPVPTYPTAADADTNTTTAAAARRRRRDHDDVFFLPRAPLPTTMKLSTIARRDTATLPSCSCSSSAHPAGAHGGPPPPPPGCVNDAQCACRQTYAAGAEAETWPKCNIGPGHSSGVCECRLESQMDG
ncbi:hypothetical protein F5X96DRAFT_695153 [Biscogniauxia mediterranea]|nr:hypothetical protein F5X96DRAFT_695153 [Biscogniauxia mediterranea]